jgi:hypothetical protein
VSPNPQVADRQPTGRCQQYSSEESARPQRIINETAHAARLAIQRNQNIRRYEGDRPTASAPQPTSAAAPAAVDPMAQLRQLDELRDAEILTEEEFASKKAEILGRL